MLRRDLNGRECTKWLLASGGKPWGLLSSWGYCGGDTRVVFLPSEDPAANMTDTCHSLPVCCALFHSDALPGIEKSRMCKEVTPGSCLCCSLFSPQGRREQACNRELPLACCLLDSHSSERAVRPRWLEWVSMDMPSPCSCHAPCP